MPNDKLPGHKDEAAHGCAICNKPVTETYAPFCSKRCADIDLHKWLGGVYAVPAADPGLTDGEDE